MVRLSACAIKPGDAMSAQPLFKLPAIVFIREEAFDETTKTFKISDDMPWVSVDIGAIKCYPVFKTHGAVINFGRAFPETVANGKSMRCNARQLITLLETIQPDGIVIDPFDDTKASDVIDVRMVLDWLRVEAGKDESQWN